MEFFRNFCGIWRELSLGLDLRRICENLDLDFALYPSLRDFAKQNRGNLVFLLNAHFLCHCEIL